MRTDSRELAEWLAYAQLEPFGEPRADLRAGIVASTIANTHRDPKVRKRPFEPQEFVPDFAEQWRQAHRPPEPPHIKMLRMVEMLNEAFGGQDLRKKH